VKRWRWITADVMYAVHDRQISEHGGRDGIRDIGLIESALARPKNLASYEKPDAADLVAAYAFGFARNHGFVDGNKRMAWIIARVFLLDNGFEMHFDEMDAIATLETLAAGDMDETTLASWFRKSLITP
jgi:death-on-curing protein